MNTSISNTTARRFALLASSNEKIFHINDLANLWLMQNKNSLRVALKRYSQSGIFYRIYRGLYSLKQDGLDPVLVGSKAIHKFCYLTTETILYREGYISQPPAVYTFAGSKSFKFNALNKRYSCRQLNDKFLYNPEGVYLKDGVNIATPERAIADMLYFNPKTHLDKTPDWKKVKSIQKAINYPLTPNRHDTSNSK